MSSQTKLIVASGNYDILAQIRAVFQESDYEIKGAFSHQDILFLVRKEKFDLYLIDGKMYDRRTGKHTAAVLAELYPNLVVVIGEDDKTITQEVRYIESLRPNILRSVVTKDLQQVKPISTVYTQPLDNELIRHAAQNWSYDEIQTLLNLGQSLTKSLDLSEVLNRVVEAARHLTHAEEGMLLLPDSESDALYLRARVGMDLDKAKNFRIKTQDTLAGHAFNTGQPVLLGEQGPHKLKTEYFVQSLLYVPILADDQPIGVLGVNNRSVDAPFSERHISLLNHLAAYAAIAIGNANQHGQIVRQARELKALVDASRKINSSILLDQTLPSICEELVRVVGVSASYILELSDDYEALQFLAMSQQSFWTANNQPAVDLKSQPEIYKSLKEKKTRYQRRDTGDLQTRQDFLSVSLCDALLVLPIIVDGTVVCVLQAYFVGRELPASVGREALGHIQQTVMQLSYHLMDVKEVDRTYAVNAAKSILTGLDCQWFEIWIVDEQKNKLRLVTLFGDAIWPSQSNHKLFLQQFPDLKYVIDTQSAINIRLGEETGPGSAFILKRTFGMSLLVLPLVNNGQVQGLIMFSDTQQSMLFSSRRVDLARTIVGQAATARENSRLVHMLETSLIELRQTQTRLIQAGRLSAVGELAAMIAHQINNPLTTIIANADLMMSDVSSMKREHADSIEAILGAGRRSAGVVRRLLSTLHPSQSMASAEPVDLYTTIKGTLTLIEAHLEKSNIRFRVDLPERSQPIQIFAVQGELDDVWLNLLVNAHDALSGKEDGIMGIEVNYLQGDPHVMVEVWDNGSGILDHVKETLFEPFITTKIVGEGTGLGLYVCRQVITRTGGEIWVADNPGGGARFFIELPVFFEETLENKILN